MAGDKLTGYQLVFGVFFYTDEEKVHTFNFNNTQVNYITKIILKYRNKVQELPKGHVGIVFNSFCIPSQ